MQLIVMPQVALHGLPSRLEDAYMIGPLLLLSPYWSTLFDGCCMCLTPLVFHQRTTFASQLCYPSFDWPVAGTYVDFGID